MLDAQFVGFAQILVYVGAVAILIVFAILLTRGTEPGADPDLPLIVAIEQPGHRSRCLRSACLGISPLAVRSPMSTVAGRTAGHVHQIGDALMSRYVLPLEVIGLLLTAALDRRRHPRDACKESQARVTLGSYLRPSPVCLLFAIGLAGALTRRNAILVLIGIELMLNAANLNFIAFWRYGPHPEALTGFMFVIFSIGVAAAEAAVGLALIIAIYRHYKTTDLDQMNR